MPTPFRRLWTIAGVVASSSALIGMAVMADSGSDEPLSDSDRQRGSDAMQSQGIAEFSGGSFSRTKPLSLPIRAEGQDSASTFLIVPAGTQFIVALAPQAPPGASVVLSPMETDPTATDAAEDEPVETESGDEWFGEDIDVREVVVSGLDGDDARVIVSTTSTAEIEWEALAVPASATKLIVEVSRLDGETLRVEARVSGGPVLAEPPTVSASVDRQAVSVGLDHQEDGSFAGTVVAGAGAAHDILVESTGSLYRTEIVSEQAPAGGSIDSATLLRAQRPIEEGPTIQVEVTVPRVGGYSVAGSATFTSEAGTTDIDLSGTADLPAGSSSISLLTTTVEELELHFGKQITVVLTGHRADGSRIPRLARRSLDVACGQCPNPLSLLTPADVVAIG